MDGVIKQPRSPLVNLSLLIITFLFTLILGMQFYVSFYDIPIPGDFDFLDLIRRNPATLLWGLPYALALMLVLLIHELGHFFACRHHRLDATLPYFIPAPTLIGTFGAFIKIKSPFSSKKSLFDVGMAGPLAGFIVAIPLIAIGVYLSRVVPSGAQPVGLTLGEPLLFKLIIWAVKGRITAGADLLVHPVAFAGWFGLLATAFNLFPIGQLDGGHILYSLIGRKSYLVGIGSTVVIVILGVVFWHGWLLWALVVTLIGLRHPPIAEADTVDRSRKIWALVALAIFILSFTPAPVTVNR